MLRAFVLTLCLLLCGCAAAARSSASRLTDSANELNFASRFGRMDLALEQTAPDFRERFIESRTAWGSEIRIVDVSVTAIQMSDDEHAEVLVQVAWMRMSESTLKNTVVRQSWENPKREGWQLGRERREAGDPGLLGEPLAQRIAAPAPNVHLPTKSLGTLD